MPKAEADALNRAVRDGDINGAQEALASLSLSLDIPDEKGRTPLMLACADGNEEITKILLTAGANPNARGLDGWTALKAAAWNRRPACVKLLLSAGARLDDGKEQEANQNGTALIAAASRNSEESVRLLLDAGADPELHDWNGSTALIWAAVSSNEACARSLLEKGANPNTRSAAKRGETPLIAAATRGNAQIIKMLLKAGARLEDTDSNGRTPLMAAVDGGSEETVRALLVAGANPSEKDRTGIGPLCLAAENRHGAGIIAALLEHGADIEGTDLAGRSAEKLARDYGNQDSEDLLRAYRIAKEERSSMASEVANGKAAGAKRL